MKRVVVIGASGGIGSALVQQLATECELYAFARSPAQIPDVGAAVHAIDITDEASIAHAAEHIPDTVDAIFVATGLLHADQLQPEKALRDLEPEHFQRAMAVNALGPALVAKHFLPKLPRDARGLFAAFSARVGSISDNRLGGWYSYRASKAALNMLIKGAAIEMGRRYKHAIIIGLHPGTVDTGLSQPFQQQVPADKLFTPEQSANYLLGVCRGLTPDDSGKCFDWQGKEIVP